MTLIHTQCAATITSVHFSVFIIPKRNTVSLKLSLLCHRAHNLGNQQSFCAYAFNFI